MDKRKIISLCAAFTVVLSCSFVSVGSQQAYGASVQDKINQATKEKKEALEKLNQSKEKKAEEVAKKEKLDHEIDLLEAELSEIDVIINEAEQGIVQKEQEIADYEAQIEKNDEDFRRRLRALDESNTASYIDLLLEAKSFSDFFARLETIREISEHDQSIIDGLANLKQGVESSRNELVLKRDEQKEARSLVTDKKSTLDAKKAEQTALINQLNSDIDLQEKLYEESAKLEQQLKDSIRSSLSSSTSSVNSTTPSGQTLRYSGGRFTFPAPSMISVTSPYGYRTHPVTGQKSKFHSGMDLAAPQGTNVLAAESGVVRMAGWNGGYGYCVIIDHGSGVATLYGHNSKLLVSSGQSVSRGQVIAKVGSTGVSTGPHVHFEVLLNGSTTNPAPYIGLG